MNVRRFFAPMARDALRRVKEELGPDAIVLSNRSVEGGVEIMALPADELQAATQSAPPREQPKAAPAQHEAEQDFAVSLSASAMKRAQAKQWQPFVAPRVEAKAEVPARSKPARVTQNETRRARPEQAPSAPAAGTTVLSTDAQNAPLMQELQAIRSMIQQQLAGFAWGELSRNAPVKTAVMSELLDAGFSPALARRLVNEVAPEASVEDARDVVRTALSRELMTLGSDDDIIAAGGTFALVGPTGVGKTTTTAKLAARCVVRHGADKLALLTTDSYRIGAHEQLRVYGRILGVSVHVVRDAADLRQTLKDLRGKHMVLIDTVGMSQRDRLVAEQASMLLHAGEVQRLLLLNATSRGDTLDDVVGAYDGPDLAGCIVTKVDEAVSLAPVLDVLVRHGLECFYVANGQRVPEDLHLPNRAYLLHRAFKSASDPSPHRLRNEEAGLLLAAGANAAAANAAGMGAQRA